MRGGRIRVLEMLCKKGCILSGGVFAEVEGPCQEVSELSMNQDIAEIDESSPILTRSFDFGGYACAQD